jgi:hypothetical protein
MVFRVMKKYSDEPCHSSTAEWLSSDGSGEIAGALRRQTCTLDVMVRGFRHDLSTLRTESGDGADRDWWPQRFHAQERGAMVGHSTSTRGSDPWTNHLDGQSGAIQRGAAGLSFADNDDNGREPRARGTELVAVGTQKREALPVQKTSRCW